ncbi:glycosyltransferase family 4 protein [soil metagenome]
MLRRIIAAEPAALPHDEQSAGMRRDGKEMAPPAACADLDAGFQPATASGKNLLRIAYLVQQFPPEIGAGPARAGEMGIAWRDAGAELSVLTAVPNRPAGVIQPAYRGRFLIREDWNGIAVTRSWLYTSRKHGFARTIANNLSFMCTASIAALLERRRPDVLIASSPPFFVHLSGWAIAHRWRVPLVLELRDLWPDYLVDMGLLQNAALRRSVFRLERFLLDSAAAVVVVTKSFRERVIEKGVPPERVHVIPNGVDLTQYYHVQSGTARADRDPRRFTVGYLGNMGASQQLQFVVEAARRVAATNPDIRFILAGDGTERAKVERAVFEARLDNLRLLPAIAKSETRDFYGCCDACLVPLAPFPTFRNTIPSKLFEVMACERPVVASVAGEAAEIVASSGAGLVAAPGDPASLAEAILRLSRMTVDERRGMGQRGRRYVSEHFERQQLSARYLALLHTLVYPPRSE